MTIEEAARILDPETSRDALWEYEEGDRLEACNEACRVAAAALRAQQTPAKLERNRWEGCEYCEYSSAISYDSHGDGIFIVFDESPKISGFDWEAKIKYCPFCGKPLTEEARAELERRIGWPDEN